MKLRLLCILSLLIFTVIGTQAQTVTDKVIFVNAEGQTITPNSTLNVSNVEDDLFFPDQKIMPAKLFISNISGKAQKVRLSYTISEMEEGQLKLCAFEDCTFQTTTGVYHFEQKEMNIAEKTELSIEREFLTKGHCNVTLQLIISEDADDGTTVDKNGPQITINFTPESTGITSSAIQTGNTYDIFDTNGVLLYKQLTTLKKLPKGIYIVKCRDKQGTVSTKKYTIY